MYDLVIRGGLVVDGSGRPAFRADVAITGRQVAAVGELGRVQSRQWMDAGGLVVSPGFVDIHSHSDTVTLEDGRAMSKVMQGVATEVIGNCGTSGGPVPGTTYGQYLQSLEMAKTSVNLAGLVGHGNLRTLLMGEGAGKATPETLENMKDLLARCLEEGAFGLSSGLEYPPGFFADVHELAGLCQVVAGRGLYSTHLRDEGPGLEEAVREALEVGRRSRVAVQISHLKSVGPEHWGQLPATIALVEAARDEGLDVMFDVYPYTASSTSLSIVVPEWAHDGGRQALVARLGDPDTRRRIEEESRRRTERQGGWHRMVVTSVTAPEHRQYEGLNLTEIGQALGKEPWDAAFDLLIASQGQVGVIRHAISPDDVACAIAHPLSIICSDGRALSRDIEQKVHPRNFGAFPRVLGKYVREEGLLTLEWAIAKMTSRAANRVGIPGRGILAPGYWADVTVFDPRSVQDQATFAEPLRYPSGICHVLVNGTAVVRDGQHTGALPGRVLRRQ